jgi:hypothetical protein
MSRRGKSKRYRSPRRPPRPRRSRAALGKYALAIVAVFGLLGLAVLAIQQGSKPSGGDSARIDDTARDPQVVAGVEVREPWVDHGIVPFDTPVGHRWLLRNTGPRTVSLGSASIETLEGC